MNEMRNMRVYFRSRGKVGGHTIRSAVVRSPMIHTDYTALCFIEWELLSIEVLHCGNMNFRLFGSRDLDLDQMTFIYELNLYSLIPLETYWICENELSAQRISQVIVLRAANACI